MEKSKVGQAVILSAGLGTRLRPITDNLPKVMVPLGGKPLLLWHIEQLKRHGVRDFFINLHYLPDVVRNYFGDGGKWGVKITYAYESEILGTAGGIKQFADQLGDVFFVMYGDMFSLVNYSKMAEAFFKLPEDTMGMMIVGRNDHPHDSDLAEVAADLRFIKVYLKPHKYYDLPSNFRTLDAGYILRKKILSHIPPGCYYEIDRKLLPDIVTEGRKFYGYETSDYLYDIGTMERYGTVEKYITKIKANA